jgi:signal transduction histidine kinase
VGSRLDREVAERLKRLTNSEIAFIAGDAIQASTLPALDDRALAGLTVGSAPHIVVLDDNEYVALLRPLSSAHPAAGGVVVVLRSRTERLRFLRTLHTQLAATAVVVLLAATLLSYAIARTVTRPLGTITNTMRDMTATGDLTRRIPVAQATSWHDEDARLLATTFNSMTAAIARFQQQEAQRERLASLGRLSTVIAHEIRNPLMIIKASMRLLRRPDAAPTQIAETAADIEGEVARLNRIVCEVLDFARPLTFEIAPTDLNALCRDAAAAVETDGGLARVHLNLDPDLPTIVTDGERLRLALVNVLANAQHAVASARPPGAVAEPDRVGEVRLSTRRVGDDSVSVRVCDDGSGIAPEDAARIFEPYFTTKRAGTGLGLAITRNIVDGLGGAIAVDSRPGAGTGIRIDLPLTAPESRNGTAARPGRPT